MITKQIVEWFIVDSRYCRVGEREFLLDIDSVCCSTTAAIASDLLPRVQLLDLDVFAA